MHWNWKDINWPESSHSVNKLKGYEKEFLHKAGMLIGSLKHVSTEDKESLKVILISDEAFTPLKMGMVVLVGLFLKKPFRKA